MGSARAPLRDLLAEAAADEELSPVERMCLEAGRRFGEQVRLQRCFAESPIPCTLCERTAALLSLSVQCGAV